MFVEQLKLFIKKLLSGGNVKHHYSYDSLAEVGKVNTVIDVGVAYGTPELYKTFSDCNLVLIDPLISENIESLKKMTEHIDNVFFVNKGVSDQCGKATISMNKSALGRSTFNSRSELTQKINDNTVDVEVEIDSLDRIIAELGVPGPYGLKIDTEGHEIKVLSGAKAILQKSIFVATEVSVANRFVDGYGFHDLIAKLHENGYKLYDILDMSRTNKLGVKYVDMAFKRTEHK